MSSERHPVHLSWRLGRVTSIALSGAALWSLALLAAGFVVPVYTSTDASSDGSRTTSGATLVAVNGPGVALVLAVPLLVTVLVSAALLSGSRPGALVAWTLTALLGGFTVLGLLSIGIFVLPVTVALLVACATQPTAQWP